MNIKTEEINDFSVLNIEGRIDSSNFMLLEEEINNLLSKSVKHLIFNCRGLSYMSSSGLRVFLIAQKRIIPLDGRLYLCNLQPSIKEIFSISGFSNIFRIFDTLDEALKA